MQLSKESKLFLLALVLLSALLGGTFELFNP